MIFTKIYFESIIKELYECKCALPHADLISQNQNLLDQIKKFISYQNYDAIYSNITFLENIE